MPQQPVHDGGVSCSLDEHDAMLEVDAPPEKPASLQLLYDATDPSRIELSSSS